MDKIINWLKENLSEERFSHSVGTAKMAETLALQFAQDAEKAKLAGLLHDCAKEIPYEKAVQIIKENNINIDEDEIKSRKIIHAPMSAYLAQKEFGVTDEEILNAIRYHTIGRIGMTDFEKIVFLADKIELNTRTEPCFEQLRVELKNTSSLDKTLLLCSKMTIKSLLDRNLPINFKTIDLYNYLLMQCN